MAIIQQLYSGHGWSVNLEEATLPDGRVKKVARAHRCDSAHVLAFSSPNHLLLLREYRPYYADYVWMLPSGHVDKESDPLEAASRELREETGYAAKNIRHYCSTRHSEGFVCENHIYIASDLHPDPLPQDADELIEVHTLTVDEAIKRVLASSIVHTVSAYALLRYQFDERSGVFHT